MNKPEQGMQAASASIQGLHPSRVTMEHIKEISRNSYLWVPDSIKTELWLTVEYFSESLKGPKGLTSRIKEEMEKGLTEAHIIQVLKGMRSSRAASGLVYGSEVVNYFTKACESIHDDLRAERGRARMQQAMREEKERQAGELPERAELLRRLREKSASFGALS